MRWRGADPDCGPDMQLRVLLASDHFHQRLNAFDLGAGDHAVAPLKMKPG